MFNEEIKNNMKEILINFAQMKHLDYFQDRGLRKRRKDETIDAVVNYAENNVKDIPEINEWLSKMTIDGYNSYYVFNYSEEWSKNLEEILNEDIVNIISVNKDNINESSLIYLKYEECKNRIVARYVSPAQKVIYEEYDGVRQPQVINALYFATIFIYLETKQIVISIHPTKDITKIGPVTSSQAKNFYSEVARYYLNIAKGLIGINNIINCDNWIYSALKSFAEEASNHNNPDISLACVAAAKKIDDFVEEILAYSGVKTEANKQSMKEEVNILFENILREEFGIIDLEDSDSIFWQNGDKVDSSVKIQSKTSTLKAGRESAMAKSYRNNAPIELLGVSKQTEGKNNKFLIQVESQDCYIVKNETAIFIKEKVIYDVIKKLSTYKPNS